MITSSTTKPAVIVSSVGTSVELIKALRKEAMLDGTDLTIIGIDCDIESSPTEMLLDEMIQVPRVDCPSFLPTLLKLCKHFNVKLIIPTIEEELPVYLAYKAQLSEAGMMVNIHSLPGSKFGVARVLGNLSPFTAGLYAAKFGHMKHDPASPPLYLKPDIGSGGKHVFLVKSKDDHEAAVRSLGEQIYVAQHAVEGIEYTAHGLYQDGEMLDYVAYSRIKVKGGKSVHAATFKNDLIANAMRYIAHAFPLSDGVICVQLIHDVTEDKMLVIEINNRFGNGYPLASYAGARYLGALVAMATGKKLPKQDWVQGCEALGYEAFVFR